MPQSEKHPYVDPVLLSALRQYSEVAPAAKAVVDDFPQLHLIVDTNIIVEDLLFLARKKRDPNATTALMEVLAGGAIVAYFPHEKRQEVQAKCREISARYNIPLPVLLEQWAKFSRHLTFVPTADLGTSWADCRVLRDPTDVEFLQARHAVGAHGVLTHDADFIGTGVRVLKRTDILIDLRNYTRRKAMQAGMVVGGCVVTLIPVGGLVLFLKGLHALLRRIPKEWLAFMGVALLIAMLFPKSRKAILGFGAKSLNGIKVGWASIEPMVMRAVEEYQKSEEEAKRLKKQIEPRIAHARRQRVTLNQAVYRTCLTARGPMTEAEIWAGVQASGFKSRSKSPLRSLASALRRHERLRQHSDGRWHIAMDVGVATEAS